MSTQTVTQIVTASSTLEKRNITSSRNSRKSTGAVSGSNGRSVTLYNRPTPLDFDEFVPWVCLEWQSPVVIVITRCNQEPYIRKTSLSKPKYTKIMKLKQENRLSKQEADDPIISNNTVVTQNSDANRIPISTFYDSRENLVEIAIVNSPLGLNRKIINAISICSPFHSYLTKLSIINGGLTSLVLHEISKMLPHSNIAEICLDGSYVPEGNYFELLDFQSQLKILSLNRCKINDVVCKEIVARMDHGGAGMTLSVLSLATNFITDTGAWFIGNMLRKNRNLLHLNLSDNKLTSNGSKFILRHLMEFPLTCEEIFDKKRRRLNFIKKRIEAYNCLEEMRRRKIDEEYNFISMKTPPNTRCNSARKKKSRAVVNELTSVSKAGDMIAKKITGEFIDSFDDQNIVIKDDYHFCIGNMKLCSLNLAYNNLDFCSIQMIYKVLHYQNRINKPSNVTGLMTLQLNGNYLPRYCSELDEIDKLLRNVITQNLYTPPDSMSAGKKKVSTSTNK